MTVASGTATTAELNTLYEAICKLEVALRPFNDGSAEGGANPTKTGRFTPAQIDTLISAVSAAVTAANA